ncbi:MAG: tRNA pseudouridine(55) synthase TruB [Gammaproteobacteria bacterium]|nr:MAG: tRNA pseudouridine(55) synthase TruB [Gammaproteobacteria bacterium]
MRRHKKSGRAIHGILLLDKPIGITSNAALQKVKYLFRAKKAGHTGSLDPMASGLLPICLGEATKITGFLLDADKHYHFTCRLGITTTTGDAEGEVVEISEPEHLNDDALGQIIDRFKGVQQQIPPMFSALKHKGKRLYELARAGQVVERAPRQIEIHTIDVVQYDGNELELDVRCSKGTYIRTLAEDIGKAIGCGAHVNSLRRMGVYPFDDPAMVTLEQLRAELDSGGTDALDALLLPPQAALEHFTQLKLTDDAAYYLRQGQAVLVPRAPTSGWVTLQTHEGRFIGVGQILDDGKVAPRRLLNLM